MRVELQLSGQQYATISQSVESSAQIKRDYQVIGSSPICGTRVGKPDRTSKLPILYELKVASSLLMRSRSDQYA